MKSSLTFGKWHRPRRQESGLAHKELAQRLGCSVCTLRRIEDRERHRSVLVAELIANGLDISPAEYPALVKVRAANWVWTTALPDRS